MSWLIRPLTIGLQLLAASGLALALLGNTAAHAATVTSASALTIGTTAALPAVVGQPITLGMSITNTTGAPIGPFSYGVDVSPNGKLSANFPGVHVCSKPGNSFSCDFLGQLQPGLTDNAIVFTVTPKSAGTITIVASLQPILGSSAPASSVQLDLPVVAH